VTDPTAAAAALLAGGLAVLPTETVYGLGARADDPRAVARVYAAKGRPADHPLIVHVGAPGAIEAWAVSVPDYARTLAAAFWPGPLTLVLPRGGRAGDWVTGGQDTVGLRVPAHPATLAVLAAMDLAEPRGAPHGVAAPSANRFGRVSPTTASHAVAELGAALDRTRDLVLDGGPCSVGGESTILDCTGPRPLMLRPGGVAADDIAALVGLPVGTGSTLRAPGTLAAHYAPRARVRLVSADDAAGYEPATPVGTVGLLALAGVTTPPGLVRLSEPEDVAAFARVLYASLREADALRLREVLAVPPDGPGLAEAVRDRLGRAAAGS
jgi:L-threonylcarbamoyladenylate synthase